LPDTTQRASERRIVLAYFSRAGENYYYYYYYYGGRRTLKVGNTEVLAGMIRQLITCDVYRIEAADSYPDDYDATVDRNVREQNDNARPGIAKPLTSISDYGTVLVGSPIWSANDHVDLRGELRFQRQDPLPVRHLRGERSRFNRTRLRRLGTARHDWRRFRGTRRRGAGSPFPGRRMAAPDPPTDLSSHMVLACTGSACFIAQLSFSVENVDRRKHVHELLGQDARRQCPLT
jgi:hypothetical protein